MFRVLRLFLCSFPPHSAQTLSAWSFPFPVPFRSVPFFFSDVHKTFLLLLCTQNTLQSHPHTPPCHCILSSAAVSFPGITRPAHNACRCLRLLVSRRNPVQNPPLFLHIGILSWFLLSAFSSRVW